MSVPRRSIDPEFSAEKLRNVLFSVYSINTASTLRGARRPPPIHHGCFYTDRLARDSRGRGVRLTLPVGRRSPRPLWGEVAVTTVRRAASHTSPSRHRSPSSECRRSRVTATGRHAVKQKQERGLSSSPRGQRPDPPHPHRHGLLLPRRRRPRAAFLNFTSGKEAGEAPWCR